MQFKKIDLGLTYEQAVHGVQSAIAQDIADGRDSSSPKHLRVGVDMSKADMFGLVELLIAKGIFTVDEYMESMRIAANSELAMREAEHSQAKGIQVTFR